jgi:DNA-binding response OmpR family regulator
MAVRSLVTVVDDDESVRESLPDLLKECGFAVETFASAAAFLASDCVKRTNCLILDVGMPGMTGLDLQQELKLRRQDIPIIFITEQVLSINEDNSGSRSGEPEDGRGLTGSIDRTSGCGGARVDRR